MTPIMINTSTDNPTSGHHNVDSTNYKLRVSTLVQNDPRVMAYEMSMEHFLHHPFRMQGVEVLIDTIILIHHCLNHIDAIHK
mmetsp:Transcript_13807/g.17370  ORF Transcript_13807/g.17370 Transcript_13807/m.17370 type:complete len:82 (-) Transcript_13807:107-352(-)